MNDAPLVVLMLDEACEAVREQRGITTYSIDTAGLSDLWRLWRDGKIKEALELWEAIQSRDLTVIAKELGDILALFGLTAYAPEVNDLAAAIKTGEWAAIGSEACDVLKLVFEEFRKQAAANDGGFKIKDAPAHIDTYTGAMARQYLADNRGPLRKAGKDFLVARVSRLRKAPEVLALFRGEAVDLAAIDPERLDKIINILRASQVFLLAASAVFPAAGVALIVVKLIIAYYDANHPQAADATDNPADKGLSLADLL